MNTKVIAALALLAPAAAWAQDMTGDAAAGESQFNRQCIACHVVQDASGEVLAGRNGKTGPNLYGVAGRVPGSVESTLGPSDLMLAYGESGAVWEEENFVAYVQDPTGFLREATGESERGAMAYQVRDEQQAHDLWAFLATFGSAEGEAAAEDGEAASE